jgi:hypothetical protein
MARSARIALALLLFAAGCKHEPAVQLPPRVELSLWPVVGVVEFTDTRRPSLGPLATRHFVEMLHAAQPGARVLELGSAQKVLAEIKRSELDFEAVRALGERYKLDAVFVADVAFSEVKPRVAIGQYWDSVSAGASVRGELRTQLYETRSGATLWTRVSSASADLAHFSMIGGAPPVIGGTDPEDAYAEVVRLMVEYQSGDFYPRWVQP